MPYFFSDANSIQVQTPNTNTEANTAEATHTIDDVHETM